MKEKELSKESLLKIPEVVEEIKRHLWLESERAGYDIGFDVAADDWIKKYAKVWISYHRPSQKIVSKSAAAAKKRSAKSYFL